MMDAGIAMSVALIVFAGLLVVNLVMKSVWMSRERWLEVPEVGQK
jgi:hypothetical protein